MKLPSAIGYQRKWLSVKEVCKVINFAALAHLLTLTTDNR